MKAYVGQVIYNDEGKMMGQIVRIEKGNIFYVPVFTPVSFGRIKYYRSESGEQLE